MLSRNKDLILIDIVILINILLPLLGTANTALRVLFALPLVFILPGYVFVEALIPNRLEIAERWAVILGISLGLTMFFGFLLNQSAGGLQEITWAFLLGGISFLLAQLALLRRVFTVGRQSSTASVQSWSRLAPLAVLLLFASILLIWWTVSFAQFGVASSTSAFTQFWMLPASSPGAVATTTPQASSTPAPSQQPVVLKIGVKSLEKGPVQYRVVVQEGSQVLNEWQGISLQPGETWQEQVIIPAGVNQTKPVQAFLYRADSPGQVYRTVTWWPQAGQ